MIETSWVLVLALMMGMIVGMAPGMSSVVGLVLCMPVIGHLPVTTILVFFACYLCVVQYYGSVSALLLKIPGETSSLPVLTAGQDLRGQGLIKGLRLTALTSFVASVLATMVFALLFLLDRSAWLALFNTKVMVLFLITLLVLLITNGRWWFNIMLTSTGLIVANAHEIPMVQELCATSQWFCGLLQPIDITLILLGLYAVPLLWHQDVDAPDGPKIRRTSTPRWLSFWPYRWLTLKHSLLGMLVGLVPGMGVTLASNLSARLESGVNARRRLAVMGAAEASNNSATISSTVPFLMLGLPITASELYLDNWFSMFRNIQVNWQIFYQQIDLGLTAVPFYYYFIGCVLLVNMMAFYLSSRLTVLYQSLASLPSRFITSVIKGSITVTLIGMIWTNGISASSLVTILLPASCLGVWARSRQIDVVALPISLVVGKLTFDTFAKAYYLYF